jgi:thioesterase domain-containing protein
MNTRSAEDPDFATLAGDINRAEGFRRATTFIAPYNTKGAKPPIFWFPSVTGAGSDPQKLAMLLGPTQPFYSCRVPSSLRNRDFASSVPSFTKPFFDEIGKVCPDGPIIIGGFSSGVVTALQAATWFKAQGRDVRHLIAIDFAPRNTGVDTGPGTPLLLNAGIWLKKEYERDPSFRLLKKIWNKALEIRQPQLAGAQGTAPAGHKMDWLIKHYCLRSNEGAFVRQFHDTVARYRPSKYPGSVLVYAANDPEDKAQQDLSPRPHTESLRRNWEALSNQVRVVEISGDHLGLMKGAGVIPIAEDLKQQLQIVPPPAQAVPGPFTQLRHTLGKARATRLSGVKR